MVTKIRSRSKKQESIHLPNGALQYVLTKHNNVFGEHFLPFRSVSIKKTSRPEITVAVNMLSTKHEREMVQYSGVFTSTPRRCPISALLSLVLGLSRSYTTTNRRRVNKARVQSSVTIPLLQQVLS